MARTVNAAFNIFLRDFINLDPEQTNKARASRNWLLSQIHNFPNKRKEFPKLYPAQDISFGSFARRTKNRELDDIDFMVTLSAPEGSFYAPYNGRIEIYIPESASNLFRLCHVDSTSLNSRKVINQFVSALYKIPQYQSAEPKRDHEAITLNLISYTWKFDIVPCFFTVKEESGRDFYLIPDGNGHWKKTDPRIDQKRVSDVNSKNNGNILNLIRLIKFWNKRPTMPSIPSYLLENIVVEFYNGIATHVASRYCRVEIAHLFLYLNNRIFEAVNDPKGIQGDINSLTYEEQEKISKRSFYDYLRACEALELEREGNHELAINQWKNVLGDNFPVYSHL